MRGNTATGAITPDVLLDRPEACVPLEEMKLYNRSVLDVVCVRLTVLRGLLLFATWTATQYGAEHSKGTLSGSQLARFSASACTSDCLGPKCAFKKLAPWSCSGYIAVEQSSGYCVELPGWVCGDSSSEPASLFHLRCRYLCNCTVLTSLVGTRAIALMLSAVRIFGRTMRKLCAGEPFLVPIVTAFSRYTAHWSVG